MSSQYINIPAFGSPFWKDPVINAAALPSLGNNNGDVRIALDSGIIYEWNGSSWVAVASPGGSPSAIDGLTGDVSASGPGVVVATVNAVGGQTAIDIASGVVLANAATSLDSTDETIIKRANNGSGGGSFDISSINDSESRPSIDVEGKKLVAGGVNSIDWGNSAGVVQINTTITNDPTFGTSTVIVNADANGNYNIQEWKQDNNIKVRIDNGGTLYFEEQGKAVFTGVGSVGNVSVQAPSNPDDWTFYLPGNAGSNGQFLQTDGTGNTGWSSNLPSLNLESGGSSPSVGYTILVPGDPNTVVSSLVTSDSLIFLTYQDLGIGETGVLYTTNKTNGSFDIRSSNINDESTVAWLIVNPY